MFLESTDLSVIDFVKIHAMTIILLVLFIVGLWLISLNWICFFHIFIKKDRSPSWIPVLPGLLIFLSIYLLPDNSVRHLAWFSFIVDWGCIPGITHALYCQFKLRNSNTVD